ncbi:MAG: Ig-like domain-containing protein [bacterium]
MSGCIEYGLYGDKRGFTFVELMISMAVFMITLLAAFEVITSQKKTFQEEREMIGSSQSARASQDILLRELRSSGYKVLEAAFLNNLSSWIASDYLPTYPQTVNLSSASCPIITQGNGSAPDMITLLMADARETKLLASASSSSTTITLDPNSPGYSASSKFRPNDIIRLGDHTEFARVVAVSGNTLAIDTNPSLAGYQGLAANYAGGAPVREINVITYTVINEENDPSHLHHTAGHPILKRKHNEADYVDVAEDVENLQIIPAAFPNYRLQLITRTSAQSEYVDGSSDGYKRTELLADFRLRNFRETSCLLPATPTLSPLAGLNSLSPCTIHVTWSAVTRDNQNQNLPAECAVSGYIVAYDLTPLTRHYTAYPQNSTSCDIDIGPIKDPNHLTYYVSVAAVNSAGVGNYSTERTIMDSNAPDAVGNLTAAAQGRVITLTWTGNPECDVSAYRIYRGTASGGPYTLIFADPNIESGVTRTYTYQDANLPCGTYYYVVRAFDDKYESVNSPQSSATVTDTDPPDGPADFSFSIAGSTVTFNWSLSADDPVSGQGDNDVCGYRIYGLSGDAQTLIDSSIPAGQTSRSLSIQGYSNFGIKAVDSCGLASSLVTQSAACQPPPTVTIASPAAGATLSGNAVISGTASSSHALSWVKIKIDDGAWSQLAGTSTWSYQWDTSLAVNGTHTITVQTLDSENCSGSSSVAVTVLNYGQGADTTPPSISNVSFTSSGRGWVTIQCLATVTDATGVASASFTYSCGGSPQGPVQMTHIGGNIYRGTYVRQQNDTCTVTISATDSAASANTATYTSSDR